MISGCGKEAGTGQKDSAIKVLWIGNSDTQSGPLYEITSRMVNDGDSGIEIKSEASVYGGRDLKYHYKKTDAVERIKRNRYDYVVLQPHATRALMDNFKEANEYAGKFIKAVRESGGEPVICSIWAEMENRGGEMRPARKESWDRLVKFHEELARKHDVILAPTCLAWREALEKKPAFPMYKKDGIHANGRGVYLNACVFYSVLTGKSPVGHPLRESMPYVSMKPLVVEASRKIMRVTLDDETAAFLQGAAWEAIQNYKKRGDIRVNITIDRKGLRKVTGSCGRLREVAKRKQPFVTSCNLP